MCFFGVMGGSICLCQIRTAAFFGPGSILVGELLPQHHEVEFNLTHKIDFFIRSTEGEEVLAINSRECLTGHFVGGISPFGTKQGLPVVMKEHLLKSDKLSVNGGRRGLMLLPYEPPGYCTDY